MFINIEKKQKLIREIIQICKAAIEEWEKGIRTGIISDISGDSRNQLEFYYNQVKDIVLPEMRQLLILSEKKGRVKGKKYSYIISDCWNHNAPLSKKILELS